MKKILIILMYFLIFWVLLPATIILFSLLLDRSIGWNHGMGSVTAGILLLAVSFPLLLHSVFYYRKVTGEYPVSAYPPGEIIQGGIFSVFRHPVYLFFSISLLGTGLLLRSSSFLLIIFPIYLLILGLYIFFEERKLIIRHGEVYRSYRKRTALLIPGLSVILKPLVRLFFRIFFRYRVTGKNHIPLNPPFIIVAAHRNYLDPFFIAVSVSFPVSFVATIEVFRNRLLKFFLNRFNAIPKARYRPDLQATKKVVDLLRSKAVIGIFPEGERSWTGQMNSFKPETLKLFRKFSTVPLLPIRIQGNFHAWPRWASNIRRAEVNVDIGEAFHIDPNLDLMDIEKEMYSRIKPSDRGKYCRSGRIADNLSIVLYRCPACMKFESLFVTDRNCMHCSQCGAVFHLLPDYSLKLVVDKKISYFTLDKLYTRIRADAGDILVKDRRDFILRSERVTAVRGQDSEMHIVGEGSLKLTEKEIIFTGSYNTINIDINYITSVTIESNYKLQIFEKGKGQLFQFAFLEESALKWQDMIVEILHYNYQLQPNTR